MNGDRVRECLRKKPVLMPGVWDALSARLTHEAEFPVAFLSGYATAATLLGLPDFGYVTQTEMAEVARRVCRSAPGLAVIVDGDTGYGNPLNTIRTVELDEGIERARLAADLGVDAIFVEAPESIAELEQIAAATPGLVRVANMIEAGKTPLLTPSELHELGFDLIVSPLTNL